VTLRIRDEGYNGTGPMTFQQRDDRIVGEVISHN
jgi:hypothetical protein